MLNTRSQPLLSSHHALANADPARRACLRNVAGVLGVMSNHSALAQADAVQTSRVSTLATAADHARGLEQLHALVIGHRGQNVLAEAFRGPAIAEPAPVKSVSKSIVSALMGVALQRGVVDDMHQTLQSLVPELIPEGADRRVGALTLDNLLSMRAGLERTSGGAYGRWVSSENWVHYVLSRPFVAEPGSRMLYSTGNYHVLGVVLSELTGKSLLSLSRQWLGAPLGIQFPPWVKDPQGHYLGGNEMAMSPLAMLSFGELYRAAGQWNGQSLMSERWVQDSWSALTRSPFSGHDYGYGWFVARAGRHRVCYARGYGGQMIYVVPDLALTVAITSDSRREARSWGHTEHLHRLLAEYIVPAIEAL